MATALDQYASLTIAYTVPGTFTPGVAGVPTTTATTEIIATCWVRGGSGRLLSEDSNVFTEIPLEGYFLQPQRPPAAIKPGVSAPAILWRLNDGFTLRNNRRLRIWSSHAEYESFVESNRQHIDHEGLFTMAATRASQYVLPDQLLGKRLAGVFSYRAQWGDVV
jgi:hypothetical protein